MATKRPTEIQNIIPGVISLRMRVDDYSTKGIKQGEYGIVCAGVYPRDGLPALVLVADDDKNNHSMSLTNAVDGVLAHLDVMWSGGFPFRSSNIVEIDSMGYFDHIAVSWEDQGRTPATFSALRWPGTEPRTREAFLGIYGVQGQLALDALKAKDFVLSAPAVF
jgi:hypothetical protein